MATGYDYKYGAQPWYMTAWKVSGSTWIRGRDQAMAKGESDTDEVVGAGGLFDQNVDLSRYRVDHAIGLTSQFDSNWLQVPVCRASYILC
jgi:hypothetical protein